MHRDIGGHWREGAVSCFSGIPGGGSKTASTQEYAQFGRDDSATVGTQRTKGSSVLASAMAAGEE